MNYAKRGDDFEFLAKRVRSKKTGALLPGATLTWRLMRQDTYAAVAGVSGSMTQYDVVEASYEGVITRVATAAFELNTVYVLEIIVTNGGRQTTIPVLVKAVDIAPTLAV